MKPRQTEEEVNRTLKVLDGMARAKADPFFSARVDRRLEGVSRTGHGGTGSFPEGALRWAAAAAAAVVLIAVNIWSVVQYHASWKETAAGQETDVGLFAEEYALDMPTLYELNTETDED